MRLMNLLMLRPTNGWLPPPPLLSDYAANLLVNDVATVTQDGETTTTT